VLRIAERQWHAYPGGGTSGGKVMIRIEGGEDWPGDSRGTGDRPLRQCVAGFFFQPAVDRGTRRPGRTRGEIGGFRAFHTNYSFKSVR